MNVKLFELESEIKKGLETSATSDGTIERLQDRIDKLESAVSHMAAFIADHFRLTKAEIHDEDGLLDW